MRRRQHLFICGQRQPAIDQALPLALGVIEGCKQRIDIGLNKIVTGLFDLVLVIDVTITDPAQRPVRPGDIENAGDVLQVHGEPLETIGQFTGYRFALEPAHLLKVGELRDLHAVQPHLPA